MYIVKKKILLISITVFALACSMYVVFLMCAASVEYGIVLIQEEQLDHYTKMHEKIRRVDMIIQQEMPASLAVIQTSKKISNSEKSAMMEQLRTLEEIAAEIERETMYYDEDNTVHMFFPPEGRTVTYFREARNTPLYISRCVRSIEQAIFATTLTKEQKNIVQENMMLLQEELRRLSVIANY